ncbi:MAG: prepilin-type N-terminal cleavage/methylation domain-containing protein [Anaerovoracaceae bacterium]
MYELLEKNKKAIRNKKGFTLVEVIVVLVILAILAAILIPSMVGYINKAEKKSVVVEARSALLATQTVASEAYVKNKAATTLTTDQIKEVTTLAELKDGSVTGITVLNGKVTAFSYDNGTYTVKYTEAGLGEPTKK